MTLRVGLIGYGEVGRVFAADMAGHTDGPLSVYDLKFDDLGDPLKSRAATNGCLAQATATQAACGRDIVFSAVTAGSALTVANGLAKADLGGALFVDVNSVSPSSKRQGAETITSAGGRYVEAVLMAPIAPRRLGTPMLLGGPHAEAALPVLTQLGFAAKVRSAEIGVASAVKMCRSVFVKGLESVVAECLVAARRYGVEAEVLDSLSNTIPAPDWTEIARYLISRTLIHGARRSEEMVEVAKTLGEVGLDAWMSEGAVRRQAWGQGLGLDPGAMSLQDLLDAMLRRDTERSRP